MLPLPNHITCRVSPPLTQEAGICWQGSGCNQLPKRLRLSGNGSHPKHQMQSSQRCSSTDMKDSQQHILHAKGRVRDRLSTALPWNTLHFFLPLLFLKYLQLWGTQNATGTKEEPSTHATSAYCLMFESNRSRTSKGSPGFHPEESSHQLDHHPAPTKPAALEQAVQSNTSFCPRGICILSSTI